MRLQELKKKDDVRHNEATGRRVRVLLQSSFYLLDGDWQWPMEAEAVFCSDVMFSLPNEFIGTKAIFHPDDVAAVSKVLSAGQTIPSLTFRIITTYGEVKSITGENIVAVKELLHDWQQQAVQAMAQSGEQKAREEHLHLLKSLDERTSRFSGIGRWYYNASTHQAWYADFVYTLHGLPPQSFNAHLHTFQLFVHPDDRTFVLEYEDKAFHNRAPLHIDYRIVVGGNEKWVSYKAGWFYSEKGEEIFGGIYQDITEQKGAEREAESYRNLVQFQRQQLLYDEQQAALGHWQINLLTRKTTYSDQYYRIFGLKPHSLSPTLNAFLNYVHPNDRERVEAAYKQLMYEHAVPDLEYRIVRNDGKTRYLLQKARLVTLENEPIVSGIIQDITVQRMLEKKVTEQADALQLRQYISQQGDEQAALLSWAMDLEENTIAWSESFYQLAGHTKAQPSNVTEKTLFTLVHPQDLKAFRQHWNNAMAEKQPANFDVRFLVRGLVQYMNAVFKFHQLNGKDYFIGTVQNTTPEQVLQQQLSQRVQLAESLSENILDKVIITDVHNTVLLWNRSCEQAYGIKKTDAVDENIFDLFPQLNNEAEMQAFQRVLRGEKVVQEGASPALGRSHFNRYLMPLYNGEEVSGILHIIHDVTKEVELRNSLHDRLRLIEGLVQSSVDRIIALDRHMNYLYWNKSAEAYYGMPKEDVLGKNILEVFPRLINDPSYGEIRKALRGETVYLPANPETEACFETYLIPIKNDKGEVVNLLWMAHDLSNEWALQKEQQRAARVLDTINELYIELDSSGRFRYVNREAENMWKKRREELLGQSIWDVFPQAVNTCGFDLIQKALTEKAATEGEYYSAVLQKWVFMSAVPTADGVVVLFHDISRRKKAEQQLQEQSHYLHRITETVPDMMSVMDLSTRDIHYLNVETFVAHGFDPEAMLRKTREERVAMIHADDRQLLNDYYERLSQASDEEIVTAEYRAKDLSGEWKWFYVRGKVFQRDAGGKVTHILNAIENITARKTVEEEIRKNLAILQQTEEMAQTGSWEYHIASGAFTWSEGMYRLFGLPQGSKIQPETYLGFVVKEDQAVARQLIRNLRKAHQSFELTMRVRKGSGVRLLRIKGLVINDDTGKPQRIAGVDLDITDMKEAEEKIRETQHWLQQTALASPDAINVYDLQKKQPVYLNNCLAKWVGTTTEELVNMGIDGRLQLVHPDDRLKLLHFNELLKVADEGRVVTLEYRLRRKDDTLMWIRNRSKIFQRDAAGNVTHILSVLQDVTQEKDAEEVLKGLNASLEKKNAELESKNEEITSFAFVASHDLKEPLRKIHTFSDWLLTRETTLSEKGMLTLEKMNNAVKRLDQLIDDILTLTKMHVDNERGKVVDLNALLQRLQEEIKEKLLQTGAVVEAGPLPALRGAENQLFYLFKNLISNAVKFQPKGQSPCISISAEKEEQYIKVSVSDNGIGIAQEYHRKIFEMFRRLHGRTEYEGTGMGLAICKKIMEKHGGKITVESEEGKGASFTCWFPAVLSTFQS